LRQKTPISAFFIVAILLQHISAYASSWNPGLLVNTETFQVIDDADTTSDLYVRFGDTLNKRLTFERTLDRFNFNDDVYVSGDLNVKGTASGKTIFGMESVRSSGSLVWEGAASGASLWVSQFRGAGLVTSCNADNETLAWNATTQRFECGDDDGGGSSTLQQAYDADANGNDAKIALTSDDDSLVFYNPASGGTDSGFVLTVRQLATAGSGMYVDSNATNGAVLALNNRRDGGQQRLAPHIMFGYNGAFSTRLYQSGSNTLATNAHILPETKNTYDLGSQSLRWRSLYLSGSSLHIGATGNEATVGYNSAQDFFYIDPAGNGTPSVSVKDNGNMGIGTIAPETKLEVVGTASGRIIHANDKLTSSGGAIIDGGSLIIGARQNATEHTFTSGCNCLDNPAAGTFGNDASRNGVVSSVVYKGKLFVATNETDAGGVYRYDGGTTWTLVTYAVGEAISTDSANIDSYVLAVFDNTLYIGSQGTADTAGLYRSTTAHTTANSFTLVNSTRGSFGMGETGIDGISSMTVWNGNLIISTQEANDWELGRYDGGTTFSQINTTGGKFVAADTADIDGAVLAVYGGRLFIGAATASTTARVGVHDGVGTTITDLNATKGTFGADTSTVNVTSLAVHNGQLYVGTSKTNAGAVYRWLPDFLSSSTSVTNFDRVNFGLGEMTSGETANLIDSVILRVYNGRLYAGTQTGTDNAAAIYVYDDVPDSWTMINGTRGTFGTNTGVNDVVSMQVFNDELYVGTEETDAGSVYSWNKNEENSYSLKFESENSNFGSISFVGTNALDTHDRHGTFRLSHGVALNTGAFDYAEDYPTSDTSLEAGEIVAISETGGGAVMRANSNNDAVGVISENPGFLLQPTVEQSAVSHYVPVALVGRVPVKVSAENGPITPGDSLTVSSKPGIAMKAKASGRIIGRAMSFFEGPGVGSVLLFINISHHAADDELASLSASTVEKLEAQVRQLQRKINGLQRKARD